MLGGRYNGGESRGGDWRGRPGRTASPGSRFGEGQMSILTIRVSRSR